MNRELVDSKIEWLGKIPVSWSIRSLKRTLLERNVINKTKEETFLLSLTIQDGVIPYSEKKSGGNKAKDDISKYKLVKEGDIVINSMNVVVGASGLSKYDGLVSPVYYIFTGIEGLSSSRYYNYLFLVNTFENHLFGLGNGILVKINEENGKMNTIRKKIPIEALKLEKIPLPPVKEQEKIADYLDKKIAKINEIIEDNKISIDLLKEYQRNILSKILKKYKTRKIKLKYLTESKLQYGANSSGIPFDENLPRYIRITDIEDECLKEKDKLSLPQKYAQDFLLKNGDILFARSGGTVGKTFQYFEKYGLCAFAGYLIKASFNDMNLASYVYNYTNTDYYNNWRDSIFIRSTIQNIGADKYSNLPIIMPDIYSDIKKINNEYYKMKSKIQETIKYRFQIIEKLEEYKKSLIYEAVTGKIEV